MNNTTGVNGLALGYAALATNTTGNYNTAVGSNALYHNTTADDNTACGYGGMYYNTTGARNAGLGYFALFDNTTGYENVACGAYSLQNHTTGYANSVVGYACLETLTTGTQNTAVGWRAGGDVTTGAYNVFIGKDTGHWVTPITTGSHNVHIGYATAGSAAGVDDELIITVSGSGSTGKGANTGWFDDLGNGIYQSNNSADWATTSDRRIKKNIVDNNVGLNVIEQLQVRNFEYKTEDEINTDNPELTDVVKSAVVDVQGLQIGVIAQELEEICPGCVTTNSTGIKTVVTDELFWHMVNAIKELSNKVATLEEA